MKLPNTNKTIIDDNKLSGYSLNLNHIDGQHKARVFKSALGLTIDDAEELKTALLTAVNTIDVIPDQINLYGKKYIIDFPVTRNNKTAIIHSVWIVRHDENFSRLVTCYIL